MREVRVKAIHNRTEQLVRYPTTSGGTIDVPPGKSVEGDWVVQYDEKEHGEIASPNEVWFLDSPDQFSWGSITFWDVGR